jgi:hypothetical protein
MIAYAVISFLLFWLTAVFYVAVMHFKMVRDSGVLDTLNWSSRAIAYLTLYVGLVLDALLNIIVMTVVFLELPKEILTTSRIRRHKFGSQGLRKRVAIWFCRNYLTPFDKNHCE